MRRPPGARCDRERWYSLGTRVGFCVCGVDGFLQGAYRPPPAPPTPGATGSGGICLARVSAWQEMRQNVASISPLFCGEMDAIFCRGLPRGDDNCVVPTQFSSPNPHLSVPVVMRSVREKYLSMWLFYWRLVGLRVLPESLFALRFFCADWQGYCLRYQPPYSPEPNLQHLFRRTKASPTRPTRPTCPTLLRRALSFADQPVKYRLHTTRQSVCRQSGW